MSNYTELCTMTSELLRKGKELGADIIGIADVSALKNGPSEQLFLKMKDRSRDRYADMITTGLPHGAVFWEEDAKSAIVFGVSHPQDKPELDWWIGEVNPPGNKMLATIGGALKEYITGKYPHVNVYAKPYHVEKGGIYLKEAAYHAGLGCIGRNNLLITPQFGPRVRLRAILISEQLPATGPTAFEPCIDCDKPCLRVCPQRSFSEKIYSAEDGPRLLPGRDGDYDRGKCALEMGRNEAGARLEPLPPYAEEPVEIIRYCRSCEWGCVFGRP